MIENKCQFCNNSFFAHTSKQRTCSRKCGYALRSQEQMKWSREKIVKEIKILHSHGIPLNCAQLKKDGHTSLVIASYRHFNSWTEAIETAELTSINKKWNRDEIIRQIQYWKAKQLPLNYLAANNRNANLISAALRYFTSWDHALKSANVSSKRLRKQKWTKQKILASIQYKQQLGYSLNVGAIKRRDHGLYKSAVKIFGSWIKTLNIAKITPKIWQCKWNRKLVKRCLLMMKKKNVPMNANHMQKFHEAFYKAAARYFGSWDSALQTVGLDPLEIKQDCFWRPGLVMRRIQERSEQGKSLYSQDIDKECSSLKAMAKKFFGSWKKAIQSAGLIYKRKVPPLWGEEILGLILSDFFPDKKIIRHCRELDWLVGIKGHHLELDFYCEDLELGLEFQGPTHSIPIFGEKELSDQRERDNRKRMLCNENKLTLIEIHYDNFSPQVLSQKLLEHDIAHKYDKSHIAVCDKYCASN